MKVTLAVIGIIRNDNKFLLTKRDEPDKQFHGYWHLPGGAVGEKETPQEAIIRELKEELGIEVVIESMLPKTLTIFRNNNT